VNRDTPLSGYSEDVVKNRPKTATWSRCPSVNVSIFTCVPGEVMLEDDVPWIDNTRASLPPPGSGSRSLTPSE
jgi:hypothetical protein